MRIIKDLPYHHINEKFYDKNSNVGIFIDTLKTLVGKEEEFLTYISTVTFWDYPKFSAWTLEDVLNYIDELLFLYKSDTKLNEHRILTLLKFIEILLSNCYHKDIFSSFDNLEELFTHSNSLNVKAAIVCIYQLYSEVKKSMHESYLSMIDNCWFIIGFRPILVDFMLEMLKPGANLLQAKTNFYDEIERIFVQILKDARKHPKDSNLKSAQFEAQVKVQLRKICWNPSEIDDNDLNNYLIAQKSKEYSIEEENLYGTIRTFLLVCSELNLTNLNALNILQDYKTIAKFTVNMLNLLITGSQRKSKTPLISEYYIEKYLKDVLAIITSKFDLEYKSIFIWATIGFVTYFDGYESILFQNGLFHSILSDLTSYKFEDKQELEVLSYEETINQDFLNTILNFLYKTSSFREIPVHFLNKILESPKNNVYPYRIDNVIFSLKKKRPMDESMLNDLVLPRLIYELNNFWVPDGNLSYLWKDPKMNHRIPSVYERSNLIQKLFKILYSIFEHNTSLSSMRYYEERMIDAVDHYIKTVTNLEGKQYEPLFVACIDFISKICNFLPSKIPLLLQSGTIPAIFKSLAIRIPCQTNILNLIFHLIHSVHLHEEGKNILLGNSGTDVVVSLFNSLTKSEYIFTNVFTPNSFITDEFFAPYTSFVRMDNMNPLIIRFFELLNESVLETQRELIMNENDTFRIAHGVHILAQFYMNITREDMEYLINDVQINLKDNISNLLELLFHPLSLLSINATVISKNMIELFEKPNPELLVQKLASMINVETINKLDKFSPWQKNKIISKMVGLTKFILKKLYPVLIDKSIIEKILIHMTKLMVHLIKSQSNINMYMSPVNDCVLIINQKSYFKFLSSKLNQNLRTLLVNQTLKNLHKTLSNVLNPQIQIFDDHTALDIKFRHDFESNMRVEIIDGNNPFTHEVIDHETKIVINSHMAVLDLFLVVGKNVKTPSESTIKMWHLLSHLLVEMISSLNPMEKLQQILELSHVNENIVENLIYYINMMNNINIVFGEAKKNSSFVIFYFIKFGGIERIFDVCVFLLKVSELYNKSTEQPLIILLLIKNLWNIINSIVTRLMKINFETSSSFSTIFIQENASSLKGISNRVKFMFLTLVNDYFVLGKSGFNLTKISKLSYSLYSLLFSILDSCLIQYRSLSDPDKKETAISNIIDEAQKMGFTKYDILNALQQGYRELNDVVDYITNNPNQDQDQPPAREENMNDEPPVMKLKPDNNKTFNFEKEIYELLKENFTHHPFEQKHMITAQGTKEDYSRIFMDVYKVLIEEEYSTNMKISQIRKMNLVFRIKDLTKNEDEDLLVSFLKEIFIMERENFIELQTNQTEETIGKLLQNWMLISYIITKDRSRHSHIFESLNIDSIAKFFHEFKVIENTMMTIRYIQGISTSLIHRSIIYECLFLIYLSLHFITYYTKKGSGTVTLPVEEYKREYLNLLTEMLEIQNKNITKVVTIDEQNLIIILSTIVENFQNDETLQKFIEKGGLRSILKIKKELGTDSTYSFNDNRFKYKVVLDETFRLFVFKIFEDDEITQSLIESIILYIFANSSNNKKNMDRLADELKEKETQEEKEMNYQIHLEDFIATTKSISNRDTLISVIKKLCIIDKKAEKNLKKRSRKHKDTQDTNSLFIKLKPEYYAAVESIINDMKIGPTKDNDVVSSPNPKPINNIPVKESARKKIEDSLGKLSKHFSSIKGRIISTIIKHIWELTVDAEKEIERCLASKSNLTQKNLIEIDTCMISLGNLIHSYPTVLPMILKYKKQKENKASFISFLFKKVFYVLNFYRNCIATKNEENDHFESLAKDKEDVVRKLGFEVNSHQAALESFRKHNIISYVIQALCYKRRNMNLSEVFLVHKARKKVLNEINSTLQEVAGKLKEDLTNNNPSKNLIMYRVSIFSLFALTEFHENSHTFSHLNPFEIAKSLFSKDHDILKNISDVMKGLSLTSSHARVCHKLTTLFLSELFRFIRINPKMKVGTSISPTDYDGSKRMYKALTDNNGDIIIEANIINEDNNADIDSDVIMRDIERRLMGPEGEMIMEEEDYDNDEGLDEGDEDEDEDDEDDEEEDEEDDEDDEDEMNEEDEGMYSPFSSSNVFEDEEEEDDEESQQESMNQNMDNNLLNLVESNQDENDFEEDEFDDEEEDDFVLSGHPQHELSVQFNDDANEYHNADNDEPSQDESEYESEEGYAADEDFDGRNIRVDNILLGNLRISGNFMQRLNADRQPILVNAQNFSMNLHEDTGDEVLFVNPYIEKPTKTEINGYFEDAITFPFILSTVSDDLFGFYRSQVMINFINRIKRRHVESINCMFLNRYISPFDRKSKRNLYFALNGSKEKVITAYQKEFTKIHEVSILFNEAGFPMPLENLEETKEQICKAMGVDLKELKEQTEKRSRSPSENSRGVSGQKPEKDYKTKEGDLLEDKNILDILPDDMREGIEKLNNEDNLVNNQILPDDLDPEILDQVNPELLPQFNQGGSGNTNNEGNENVQENNNTVNNPALDLATFLYSLPPDLREEVLLTVDPSQARTLPQDLLDEYNRLLDLTGRFYIFGGNNPIRTPTTELRNTDPFNFNYNFNVMPSNKKTTFSFTPPKYKIEEILADQKHHKEHSAFILSTFDDEFIENLITFNIKFICEATPKSKIATNQYWILVRSLIQNTGLRHKIMDILFMLWICDSMCINKLIQEGHGSKIEKNLLLRNLHELYINAKVLEEFFYDDYDQFIKNFCVVFPKEMKKFFLETNYTEKGEYRVNSSKVYSITKNSMNIKELLRISYEKEENVLSNLISLMLINSKSDIKKIFALKIFTNIITNCLKTDADLKISQETIEKIVDLFYNFETVLEINKDKKSNNPTLLLSELVRDNKSYSILLNVLQNHIKKLNEAVSFEMDNFFTLKNISLDIYARPLPENVLFKIIKLVNQLNIVVNKTTNAKDKTEMIAETKNDETLQRLNEFIKSTNSSLILCWEKLDLLLFGISKLLKEDQKVIDPKLNRLIPYLEAFITLSHLQFLADGKQTKEINPFIMEKTYRNTPRRTPQLLQHLASSEGDFSDFFFRFCDKNKKTINLILRRYPKMFPPEILIKISQFLDLENKKKYFRYELRKLKSSREQPINLRIRREHLFMDSYNQFKVKKADEVRGKLTITFVGEEAIDAGGVKREWFTLLSKEMFNPNFMLFKLAANGNTYMPNSESGMFESDHLELFAFVGRVIAKAIYDGIMLDCYFTRSFYKLICNIPLTYHDMEDYDPEYFKSLKWLLETDISDMGELFTFSYVEDRFGQVEVIDLIEDGRNVSVTEENKFEYVQKLCYAKLFENIKPQVEAFQKGFYEIIPMKLISIFDHRELELVISGLPTVDLDDLKNNTIYENYSEESQVIKAFWEILESYDNNERTEFIQFVTGSSKVPMEGFSALQGIGGVNKFKISKVFDKNFDRLPTAHTCTNQLDLPEYPSKEILYERLNLAIKEGKVGFGFV